MNLRKLNNVLHRDLGYFFVGMTLIYSISGIAVNHKHDWNPNYVVKADTIHVDLPQSYLEIYKSDIVKVLDKLGESKSYKEFYFPDTNTAKVFYGDSNLEIDLKSGFTTRETVKRKPVFYEMNLLHYNPGKLWTYFSDIYAVGLFILAITGLFVIRGKQGLTGRGKWFVSLGVIIPVTLLIFYLTAG